MKGVGVLPDQFGIGDAFASNLTRRGSSDGALEAFARNIVKEFQHRFRNAEPEARKADVRYVFAQVVAALGLSLEELPPSKPAERLIPNSLKDAA